MIKFREGLRPPVPLDEVEDMYWDARPDDADTWVPYAQPDEAVRLARRTGKLVSALSSVVDLGQDCTETLLSGRPLLPWQLSAERARTDEITVQSSMTVVARMLWQAHRRVRSAVRRLGRRGQRLLAGGAAFHLWHPSTDVVTRKMDPLYQKNLDRWLCYAEATTEDELRQIQIA